MYKLYVYDEITEDSRFLAYIFADDEIEAILKATHYLDDNLYDEDEDYISFYLKEKED